MRWCRQSPCPYGEWDDAAKRCVFLRANGDGTYDCVLHDQIKADPGSVIAPAFGTGCCSPLNEDRRRLLDARRSH